MQNESFIKRLAFLILLFIVLQSTGISQPSPDEAPNGSVRYAFLFIGDGMGLAQVNLTEGYLAELEGKIELEHLGFTRFPEVGLISTYAHNDLITGSAAAATALACGTKTNIGRISMDAEGTENLETIAEIAKKAGFRVGVVTSVSIDHATPAAFYAHQASRDQYFEIGLQLPASGFDYFAGGGFIQPDGTYEEQQVNLVQYAREHGYQVVNSRAGLDKLALTNGKTLVLAPRQGSEASLPFAIDMEPGDFTLKEYTQKAIQVLDNDTGFFLMVEGGKIDWAAHQNDAATMVQEVIAFDQAIAEAFAFYKKYPDETLIVVTADHETGGLALGNSNTGHETRFDILKYQKSSLEELNRITGQFRVNRSGDPDADFTRMLKALDNDLGLNSRVAGTLLDSAETAILKDLFNNTFYSMNLDDSTGISNRAFMYKAVRMMAEKAGIGWTTNSHTAINVPVYAVGKGSEEFKGYLDNTDIPKIMERLMGL